MSKQFNEGENAEKDAQASGLLLSVEPLSGKDPLSLSPFAADDDSGPVDTDTDDTVGDTDTTDDTDTDISDDADDTDDAG